MLEKIAKMACEEERTRLIGQIASLLREGSVPAEARKAGLTLIGWLARRMPGEPVSLAGVEEMLRRCAEHGYNPPETMNGASTKAARSVKANGAAESKRNGAMRGNGRRSR
jgi:hypothetical protein